jgi:ubiquinone/menaquinone biosynthesis C-methylase UbiE
MSNYKKFAKFYDEAMGKRVKTITLIQGLIKQSNPNANTVLELACGTGAVLEPLAKDYVVSGLDLSSEMLKVAKKKLPKAKFYHQDMTNFKLDEKYDVILCLFDSINHLLKFNDWQKVFIKAAEHLNDKGVFIFDINTQEKLILLSSSPVSVRQLGKNYLLMQVKDAGRGVTDWEIKVLEKTKPQLYRSIEETIKEISFSKNQIQQALIRKFKKIKIVEPDAQKLRLYFICQK